MLAKIKDWLLAALGILAAVLFALFQRSEKKQAQDKAERAEVDAQVSQELAKELAKGEVKAHDAEHGDIDIDQFTKP